MSVNLFCDEIYQINNLQDLNKLFPKTVEEIKKRSQDAKSKIQILIQKILGVSDSKRTFENTAKIFDDINRYYYPAYSSIHLMELLNPDKLIRQAAHDESLKLNDFFIENVSNNIQLYKAIKAYLDGNAKKENLDQVKKYYLQEILNEFKRNGLNLNYLKRESIKKLKKELAGLTLNFEANIAKHKCDVQVSLEDLNGLKKEFIETLEKTTDGNYILRCDYPTYYTVISKCKIEDTRKKIYLAFTNRAYPENLEILKKIRIKRDKLARLVGFQSYAHLIISNQMAKTPAKVESFLENLLKENRDQLKSETKNLISTLPESVTLTEYGKIKPWDLGFLKAQYKKRCLKLEKISEYFQTDYVISQMLKIFEQFFELKFKIVEPADFWYKTVKLILVYDKNGNEPIGYIFLDLFPRDGKYTHSANKMIIHATENAGKISPFVSVIVTNFPPKTDKKASLLKFKNVKTLFHEFGHAMHNALGRTELYCFSGSKVKKDFSEFPSQMLEKWLADKKVLKTLGRHYKTGESLPEGKLNALVNLPDLNPAISMLDRLYKSFLSLELFKNPSINSQELAKSLYEEVFLDVSWEPENHMQASFDHLTGYGPSYYGYLWANFYAKQIFAEFEKSDLFGGDMAKKYIKEILSRGGSLPPEQLITNFRHN